MTTAIAFEILYTEPMNKLFADKLSDEALLARICEKDETAFEAFCRRYLEWAHRFDMRFLEDRRDAEDAVQEKFLRIWRCAETYEPVPGARVTNYLLKIDKNICLDMLRKSYRKHEVSVAGQSGFDEMGESEVLDFLDFCHHSPHEGSNVPMNQHLSEDLLERIYRFTAENFNRRQFLVFWGFVSGMTYSEISATYEMQPGSVRGYVARSFAAVRKEFGSSRSGYE